MASIRVFPMAAGQTQLLYEIFKNALIREKGEHRIAIELYGPDNKLLAR